MLTETRPSEKRDGNCHVLADSRWEMLIKSFRQPLGNTQRLLESLWAILKWYRKSTGKCPNIHPLLADMRGGKIAQQLLAKTWQFPFISSDLLSFCLHLFKVEEAVENCKIAQWFFSYFYSFQPYHL
jgi:hypothetical protein